MAKRFKWTLEIEIDECWVADGFDFDSSHCLDLSQSLIEWAESHEVTVRVIGAPSRIEIREAQGYTIDPAEFFEPEPALPTSND